jgi:ATP-binding cassette subfamily D (ALD) protein 3
MRFFKQMKMLLPILVPGPLSRETGLLVALAGVLIARTWLDIWFSAFNGQVVKSIVSRDRATFVARAGIEFGLMMWPLSVVNNSLKLLINALSISFRERLTKVCG